MAVSIPLKPRYGTTSDISLSKGKLGEIVVNREENRIVVMDGITLGGHPLAKLSDISNTEYATEAGKLKTGRIIELIGAANGSVVFDGTEDVQINVELKASGVVQGEYTKVTVDEYGIVTAGENPTTLGEYGITDALTTQDVQDEIAETVKKLQDGLLVPGIKNGEMIKFIDNTFQSIDELDCGNI